MLRHLALASGLLLTACSASSAGSNASDSSHPAWLAGTLTGPTINGDEALGTTWIDLKADGTAVQTGRSVYHNDYEEPGQFSMGTTWTFDGTTLDLDYEKYSVSFAAGCHVIELYDNEDPSLTMSYAFGAEGPIAGCPQTEPALTEAEQTLVGNWSTSDANVFLGFDDSRAVYWSVNMNVNYYRWSLDDDGKTFHITDPDGTEEDTGTITIKGSTMSLCDGPDGSCTTLKRAEK